MLRLGIIGCGRVTTMFHLNAVVASGVVELVSISDKDNEQLAEVKDATGVNHVCSDYHELLALSEVEAVAINTPPRFHEEMTLEAIKAKKHVLCEKPLAQTVEGCLRIREAMGDLIILPAHNYIYTPALYGIEEKIKQGAIGNVKQVKLNFENSLRLYGSKTDFRTKDPRGIIEDVMPHILSVAGIVAGKPEKIGEISGSCKKYKVCDNLHVIVETERDVTLDCTASWTRTIPKFGITIDGERGRLRSDFALHPYNYTLETEDRITKISERGASWYLDLIRFKHPSFPEQYRHFNSLIKRIERPRITVDDEIAILMVMQEIGDRLNVK